jgi:hypothetical protein
LDVNSKSVSSEAAHKIDATIVMVAWEATMTSTDQSTHNGELYQPTWHS